jgi:hypothetical protein
LSHLSEVAGYQLREALASSIKKKKNDIAYCTAIKTFYSSLITSTIIENLLEFHKPLQCYTHYRKPLRSFHHSTLLRNLIKISPVQKKKICYYVIYTWWNRMESKLNYEKTIKNMFNSQKAYIM